MFAAKILDFAHGVKDRRTLVGLDTGNRRLLRLERTTAGRHDDGLALEALPAAGAGAKRRRFGAPQNIQRFDQFAIMEGRVKRFDLPQQGIDEPLPRYFCKAWDIVDRLFGIKFGTLAAG